jgi:8-oxo-dGTP pyrophosphatase MutT (NUDIX family)
LTVPCGHTATRADIAELITSIEPYDGIEADHRREALAWVHSGQPLFRTDPPDRPSPHLVSYFPVCAPEARSVLLAHHRKAGLWLPPGGHVEPGEHPQSTVRREAAEELGLAARFLSPDPLFITVTATRGPASHVDISLWYVLTGHPDAGLVPDPGEFHAVRWFGLDGTDWSQDYDPHFARFAAKLRSMLA